MLRHVALGSVLSVLGGLALAGTASADPGNGAQHLDISRCVELALGVLCTDEDLLINQTENPKVVEFFIHTEGSTTFTGAAGGQAEGCSQTSQYTAKSHSLLKAGEFDPQVQAVKGETVTITVDCFGASVTCAFTNSFHYANGRLQYDRLEGSCAPQ
jgi:hypothetical protein